MINPRYSRTWRTALGGMLLLLVPFTMAHAQQWQFQVFLDDSPIGHHHFTPGLCLLKATEKYCSQQTNRAGRKREFCAALVCKHFAPLVCDVSDEVDVTILHLGGLSPRR